MAWTAPMMNIGARPCLTEYCRKFQRERVNSRSKTTMPIALRNGHCCKERVDWSSGNC